MFGYFWAFGWALLRRCLGYLFVIACGIFCVCDSFAWVFLCFFVFSLGHLSVSAWGASSLLVWWPVASTSLLFVSFLRGSFVVFTSLFGSSISFLSVSTLCWCLCYFVVFFGSFLAWFPWLFGWALRVLFCKFFVLAWFIFFLLCGFVTVVAWLTFSFFISLPLCFCLGYFFFCFCGCLFGFSWISLVTFPLLYNYVPFWALLALRNKCLHIVIEYWLHCYWFFTVCWTYPKKTNMDSVLGPGLSCRKGNMGKSKFQCETVLCLLVGVVTN